MRINWNIGGLHFSQEREVFSPIVAKNEFISVSDVAHAYIHDHICNQVKDQFVQIAFVCLRYIY